MFLTLDEAQAKLGYNDKRFFETVMCGALQPYFISSNGKGYFPVENARHIAKFLIVTFYSGPTISGERVEMECHSLRYMEEPSVSWRFLDSDCDPENLIIKPLPNKSKIDQRIEIILDAIADLGIPPHGVKETKDIRQWCEKNHPDLFPPGKSESSIWRKAWKKGKGLEPGEFKYWTKIE